MCQKCGHFVSLKDKFCTSCGAKLEDQSTPLNNDIKKEIDERIQQRKDREELMNKYSGGDFRKNLHKAMLEKQGGFSTILQERIPFENKDPSVPDIKGIELLEQLNFPAAIDFYESLLSKNSSNHRFWNNMGVAFMGMKNRKNALNCYDQALGYNPKYYIGWYNKGAVFYECEQFEDAITYFDKALEINPLCGEAYNDRKIAREKSGHFEFSMGEDFELMRKGMNLMRARMNLNSTLVDLGNNKDAILGHSKIILKFQEQIKNILDAASTYEEHGNINAALAQIEEGLDLNPEYSILWVLKGRILSQKNEADKALICLNNAIKYDPIIDNPKAIFLAYWVRAVLRALKNQRSGALDDLKIAECINPFDPDIKMIRLQIMIK